jgi:hypothetical protein
MFRFAPVGRSAHFAPGCGVRPEAVFSESRAVAFVAVILLIAGVLVP